jgi:DNA polymerase-3 subunit alpha
METLRKLVQSTYDSAFYQNNKEAIDFELNHLELHSLDDYLLKMHEKGVVSSSNEGNSHVAYLIGVTNKAPEGEVVTSGGSFPDIDLDFEKERRHEVREHLVERYGAERVASIGTFQFPKPKGLFKDVARMYDLDFNTSNKISKIFPDRPDLTKFEEALAESHELQELYNSDPKIKEIIDYASKLEGTVRTVGIHACGMCISIDPIDEVVPLFESKGEHVTQFDGPTLEKIGLIKYDILGLKNLSTISKTIELVKKRQDIDIDIEEDLDFKDPKAYGLIEQGNSLGIFQIEGSQGLRDFAKAARPQNMNELAAVISLYRPGPMGMGALNEYIARKNGQAPSEFRISKYNHIFEETYGLLIFQEQLMRLASEMCGFDDIETDVLRKAVGKKDRELLLAQKEKFVQGAVKNGESERLISDLFDEMEEFARYCFNKSHAICYAKIGYQTAWLKAYYPSEYMAALISTEDDPEQQSVYIQDARRNGINVMPPDLNHSVKDFTVNHQGEILFGFNCIKGVGGRAVDKILSIQTFDSFGDFLIKSFHAKGINKKIVEALIRSGSCDVFGWKRSCMIAHFEHFLVDYQSASALHIKENELIAKEHPDGFDEIKKVFLDKEQDYFEDPGMMEYPLLKILDYEKELLGINISGDPFEVVSRLVSEEHRTIAELEAKDQSAYIMGQINKVKRITTKKGDPMAFFDMTDREGSSRSFTLFPNNFDEFAEFLVEGAFVLAMTNSKTTSRGCDFIVAAIRDLSGNIEKAYKKEEEKQAIKSINVNMVGPLGIVRFKSLIKKINNYVSEENLGYTIALKCDINNISFTIKEWSCKQIDIPMLRDFGRLQDVYVTRGN